MILSLDPEHIEAARSLAVGLRRLDRPVEADSVLKALTPDRSGERDLRQQLDIDPHPFQFRYATGVSACFDLPNDSFQSPIKFS